MIVDSLHKQFPDMPNLRTREIQADTNARKVICVISYPNVKSVDKQLREQIRDCVKQQLPQGFYAVVSFVEDSFSVDTFRNFVVGFIKKNLPILSTVKRENMDVSVVGTEISLTFRVNSVDALNLEAADFCNVLVKKIADYSCYTLQAEVVVDDQMQITPNSADLDKRTQLAFNRHFLKPSRFFVVEQAEKYIGKQINSLNPMYICDVRKPMENCVLCGVISQKSTSQSKKNPLTEFTKFVLTDGSGSSIPCVMFTKLQDANVETIMITENVPKEAAEKIAETRSKYNVNKKKKIVFLCDDTEVLVRGRIAQNRYSGKLEMTVFDLCKCKISSQTQQLDPNRPAPDEYMIAEPEVFAEMQQENFFAQMEVPSVLTGTKLVVLRADTTGYNTSKDKMYGICGVKLVDGKVTERLFTYLNPEMSLSDSVLSKLGIEQSRLTACPNLTETVCDLYKFCFGCELVGENLSQLVEYLNYYAMPFGYVFANKLRNQTELLQRLFENSTLPKVPNCSKLVDVAKQCKVGYIGESNCFEVATLVGSCIGSLSQKSK